MGIAQTLYDWLGNKLSTASDATPTDSTFQANVAKCAYAELARLIGASYVSAALQACDIRFYGADGKRTLDDSAWLWNVSPNQNYGHTELIDRIVSHMFADGEAIVVPFTTYGKSSLWVADDWDRNANSVNGIGVTDHFTNILVNGRVMSSDFYAGQLYRFDLDGTGDKRFTHLKQMIGEQYSALADSAATAYKAKNVRRYKWKRSSTTSGDLAEQAKQAAYMRQQVQSFVTAEDIAVWPEYNGNELEAFASQQTGKASSDNASTDYLSLCKGIFELSAMCMRMPTSMLYGNVNNFSTVFDDFVTFTIDPVAHVIGDELTRKTYNQDDWSHGAHADIDTSKIQHRDLYEAAQDIDKLIGDGVVSVNDVLADFSRDQIDEPWASEHLRTKNYDVANSDQPGGDSNDE